MNHLKAEAERLKKMGSKGSIYCHVISTTTEYCDLELTIPPSVNKYYATIGRRRVVTKIGREYKEAVSRLRVKRIEGRIAVTIEFFAKDKRRRDLDNVLKCLLDSLQGCGLYKDDSQVDRIVIARREQNPKHFIKVYVEQLQGVL